MFRQLWQRLMAMAQRNRKERELNAELRFHLEQATEENMRRGMNAEDARREAQRSFGGIEQVKEAYREASRVRWLEESWQDVRFGLRMLRKRPGFTLIAVLTLALGIGANTAIFSLVNAALLRPLPIAQPERFVALSNTVTGRLFPTFSYPNYKDIQARTDVFSGLIAYRFVPLSLSHDGINERLWGYAVTGNYFEVLGLRATLGRLISLEDDRTRGAHPVTVISHQCWQARFGGNPSVIGKEVIVNGRNYSIIGVAPPGFIGTEIIAAPEMWFPMMMQAQLEMGNDWLDKRGVENIFVQGNLKPDVSGEQAQAALDAVAAQLAREFPDDNEGRRVLVTQPGFMNGSMRTPVLGFASVLMVVVGLVLLLACANLANLLLARATERRREMAVRLAMGAGRFRLIRQLLIESILLACGGGTLGCLLAWWLTGLTARYKPPIDAPANFALQLDQRVLLFAFLLSLVTGVAFGLLPALQATKTNLVSALKDDASFSTYRSSWLKNGLIALQVALSLVLLIGGGLMVRALQQAETIPLGFVPQNAISVSFDLRLQGYEAAQGREAEKRLLENVRALPGVKAAGIADIVPVDLHISSSPIFIEGQSLERTVSTPRALSNRVSPGYFAAMQTRIVQGREFTEQDNEQSPRVVIVNETFARRFWPRESALHKRFRRGSANAPLLEIIGVAQDGKYAGLNEEPQPFIFRPLWQSELSSSSLIVRAETDPQTLIAAVRRELQQLDPRLPIAGTKTMTEQLSFALLPARLAASVLGGFGLLALALAAIGLYGVMAYSVAQRTREIGIRLALGAQVKDIHKLIIGQGLKLALIGVGIGFAISLAVMRLMKKFLFGVSATDPLTFVAIGGLLVVVAFLACYLPARRATKVDPLIALRTE
jgi:macrolide transport system ATP-binding/permease protein